MRGLKIARIWNYDLDLIRGKVESKEEKSMRVLKFDELIYGNLWKVVIK